MPLKEKIAITSRELKLILNCQHPEYHSDSESQPIEAGKGADFHYERTIIRLSDNAKLTIGYTHNSDVGYQDWVQSGDFVLDNKKENIYDKYGQRLENKTDETDETDKEITIGQKYKELKEDGLIPEHTDSSWIRKAPIDSLLDVISMAKEWQSSPYNDISVISKKCFSIAVKHHVNAERIWAETFQNLKLLKASDKRITDYLKNAKQVNIEGFIDPEKYSSQQLKDLENFPRNKII